MTIDNTSAACKNIGAELTKARQALNLSEKDMAARLHLSPKIIDLLENSDLTACSIPPTFIRGYLRSYTRLLKLPEAECERLFILLDEIIPSTAHVVTTPAAALPATAKQPRQYARFITYGIVVSLTGLVSLWWSGHTSEHSSSSPAIVAEALPPASIPAQAATTTTAPVVATQSAKSTVPAEEITDTTNDETPAAPAARVADARASDTHASDNSAAAKPAPTAANTTSSQTTTE